MEKTGEKRWRNFNRFERKKIGKAIERKNNKIGGSSVAKARIEVTRTTWLKSDIGSLAFARSSANYRTRVVSLMTFIRRAFIKNLVTKYTRRRVFFFELITPESISSRDTCGYYTRVEKGGRNFISCDIMHGAEVMLDEVW